VGAVALDIFCPLDATRKSRVTPFPAIFALGNSQIHVGFSDHSDVIAHIKASVDK